MDITQIIATVVSAVLSVGAVAAFVTKYISPAVKYAMLAKDAVETLSDVVEALKDGKLAPEEIEALKNDVAKFKADLKV
jgi:hypothetical protein